MKALHLQLILSTKPAVNGLPVAVILSCCLPEMTSCVAAVVLDGVRDADDDAAKAPAADREPRGLANQQVQEGNARNLPRHLQRPTQHDETRSPLIESCFDAASQPAHRLCESNWGLMGFGISCCARLPHEQQARFEFPPHTEFEFSESYYSWENISCQELLVGITGTNQE